MPTCCATATDDLRADPATAAIFLNQGEPWVAGDRLVQARPRGDAAADRRGAAPPASTRARSARRSSPRARPARASSRRPTSTSTARRELAPIECDYRGYRIVSAPPPSSGGVDPLRDAEHPRGLSAEGLGLPLGAGGARADRGDAPCLPRPQQLPRRPRLRAEPARRACSTRAMRRGSARAIDPQQGRRSRRTSSPASPPHEGSNTTHYSIVDRQGQRGRR